MQTHRFVGPPTQFRIRIGRRRTGTLGSLAAGSLAACILAVLLPLTEPVREVVSTLLVVSVPVVTAAYAAVLIGHFGILAAVLTAPMAAIATGVPAAMILLLEVDAAARIALAVAAYVILGFVTNLLVMAIVAGMQTAREAEAEESVWQPVSQGRPVEFFTLYLRPFRSTQVNRTDALGDDPGEDAVDSLDVESHLRRAVEPLGPFVALGTPITMLDDESRPEVYDGAARIFSADDDWQDRAARLMDSAGQIVMLPLDQPSTQWELGQLVARGLIGKVVFLMPERVASPGPRTGWIGAPRLFPMSAFGRFVANEFDIGQDWARAVAAAEKFGVQLPPYANAGALFRLDPETLQVNRSLRLSLCSTPTRHRAVWIRAVLRQLGA
jgi:hypothetical protein